ncbi:MAG TPA: 50S ribosomal protein L9 [Acidimicrobiales bacterium]|jgi:large subunit ribosomal protein L9|nr:50S ribosomal protein L9 [Acidimicrobiales bacterium]
MKVLLRSDVRGLGRRGDIVVVKSGYARNFLLPSGAALVASDSTETQATLMRKARDILDAKSREAAEAQKALIEKSTLTIGARASANGRLFGSIGETDIVNAIRTATGISLDRHAISLAEHLKEVGNATATATLFDGVVANVTIEVVAK